MPLLRPYPYLVSFDFNTANGNYVPLFAELQRSSDWWHYMNTTWIVIRLETIAELQDKLAPLIYQNDRMLIMPATGPTSGWLTNEAWNWVNEKLPRLW